jgi:hypothetical protein
VSYINRHPQTPLEAAFARFSRDRTAAACSFSALINAGADLDDLQDEADATASIFCQLAALRRGRPS